MQTDIHAGTPMNWDDFKHFLSLARRRRLTLAAADLRVDQATVGRRITALEASLGAQLFERTPKGWRLTDAGERLLPLAERMEGEMLAAQKGAASAEAGPAGAVRVGAPIGAASYLLADAAADLIAAHERLEIELIVMSRVFNLSQREADFSIAVSPPEAGRLRRRKIADYPLYLYMAADRLAAGSPIETRADLARHPGVGYVADLVFDKALDYASSVDESWRPRLTSSSLEVQVRCALAGGGAAVLPEFIARRHPALTRILPDEVKLVRSYWLVIHEDVAEIDRIRLVADRFADAIKIGVREG